jgi:hypothetical protein
VRAGETLVQIWAALTADQCADRTRRGGGVHRRGLADRGRCAPPRADSVWFGVRAVDGVLFRCWCWALVLVARAALAGVMPIGLLRLAVPIFASLAIIRTLARVLAVAFPNSRAVDAFARTLSWLVWLGMVLWVTDLLPMLLDAMEELHWKIAGNNVTLLAIIQGGLTALTALVLVLWLSAVVESRLMRAQRVNMSVRKILANATRALLLLVGALVALSAAGIR